MTRTADWIGSLPPAALAVLVIFLSGALFVFFVVCWFLVIAARSGAGETNEGER